MPTIADIRKVIAQCEERLETETNPDTRTKVGDEILPELRRLVLMATGGAKAKSGGCCAANCYSCRWHREVAGNTHISCQNPDVDMTGDPHGIAHGWFFYPMLFDPTWMTAQCRNFQQAGTPKP